MNYTDPFDGNDYGDEQEENEFWTEDDLMQRRLDESEYLINDTDND